MKTIGAGILIALFILTILMPTLAIAEESNWDRYQRAHEIAEGWRQKFDEQKRDRVQREILREEREQTRLLRKQERDKERRKK
jgi:hypothetical protein